MKFLTFEFLVCCENESEALEYIWLILHVLSSGRGFVWIFVFFVFCDSG